jgi:hypothetical protein
MTQSKYRGNSPGKIAAFTAAYNMLTRQQLWGGKHIVIAGSNGDTQHLKRLEVRPTDIISCDQDAGRIPAARREGVMIPPPSARYDIRDTVGWALKQKYTISSVHVDLMRTVKHGSPILDEVLDVIENSNTNPLILFTFLCYHDPGLARKAGEDLPGQARKDYLVEHARLKGADITYLPYMSDTRTSSGSPMCLAHFRLPE